MLRDLGESRRNVSRVVSSGGEEVSGRASLRRVGGSLVRHTPGEEGKWFAAAKDAKLFNEAVALANATPCDPKTLTRAARDFAQTNPAFAVEAGLAALRWLVRGFGYEITAVDVSAAYSHTLTAAANAGVWDAVRTRIRALFDDPSARSGFVASVIGKDVGLN